MSETDLSEPVYNAEGAVVLSNPARLIYSVYDDWQQILRRPDRLDYAAVAHDQILEGKPLLPFLTQFEEHDEDGAVISRVKVVARSNQSTAWRILDQARTYAVAYVYMANPSDVHGGRYSRNEAGLYVLSFGWNLQSHIGVWADSLDDALEEAASAAKDWDFNIFVSDEEMKERYADAQRDIGYDPKEFEALRHPERMDFAQSEALSSREEDLLSRAQERAEQDLLYTESGYMRSDEWNIYREPHSPEPSYQQLVEDAKALARLLNDEDEDD